jgi:hypothetical protein
MFIHAVIMVKLVLSLDSLPVQYDTFDAIAVTVVSLGTYTRSRI